MVFRFSVCGLIAPLLLITLICFATPCVNMRAEHRPDNLADMEPMVWYDLIDRAPYFNGVTCDPFKPGRMLSNEGHLYESRDYGRSWTQFAESFEDETNSYVFTADQTTILRYRRYSCEFINISMDMGATWITYPTPHEFDAVTVSPFNGTIIAVEDHTTFFSYWLSSDMGRTWIQTHSGTSVTNNERYYIYFSPFDEGRVIAINGIGAIAGPTNILISDDDGRTWTDLPVNPNWSIRWVSYHPHNRDEFFLMFTNDVWTRFPIRRTTDGGQTWEEFGPDCSERAMLGEYLFVDPDDPSFLVYSMHFPKGTQNGGIFVSNDSGVTWKEKLTDSAQQGSYTYRHGSTVWKCPWGTGKVYVKLEQIYESDDYGDIWAPMYPAQVDFSNGDLGLRGGYIDPEAQTHMIYAQTYCGLFYSDDAGITWNPSKTDFQTYEHLVLPDICVDSNNKDLIYFSTLDGSGICRTINKGKNWQTIKYSGIGDLYRIKASIHVPNRLFGIVRLDDDPNQTRKMIISDDCGETWRLITTPKPTGLGTVIESRWDNTVWYGIESILKPSSQKRELWLKKSIDQGLSWTTIARICPDIVSFSEKYSYKLELYQDPNIQNKMFCSIANEALFVSCDDGKSFEILLHYIGANGRLYVSDSNIIHCGILRSTNNGKTWNDPYRVLDDEISPPGTLVESASARYFYKNSPLRIIKIEGIAPILNMSGFGTTWIHESSPGYLDFLVWATDPGQNDRVTSIELFWDNEPTGFTLYEELVEASGLFWIQIPVEQINDDLSDLSFRAKDAFGYLSAKSHCATIM